MSAVGQSNPFSGGSDYNALRFIIDRALDDVQTVSVVQVKAVNPSAQTVDILVLVNLVTGSGTAVPHGVIASRPYYRLQGGANAIIIDPKVGDIGIVVFASRDLTAVIAAKGPASPGSAARFSWADGIYIGGILNSTPTQYLQFLGGSIKAASPMLQTSGNLSVGTGYTGTFTTPTGNVVTVQNGIITNVD